MQGRKTLNDHLFDQMDRLSLATNETIDLETDKATHIIAVAEKILDAAQLKIQIMQIGKGIESQFPEIDKPDALRFLENNKDDKKKD